jgi:CopG family transcriptional regulator, nickel-responsive regulator
MFLNKGNTMKPTALRRFSVSMPADLVRQLDALARARGFANRSQAVAELARGALVEHRAQESARDIAGSVTLVYDHHKRNIQALLTDIQHAHQGLIVATLHVHLDHHNCMEVLALRGQAAAVRHLADRLIAAKGVKHGKLTVTTTGQEFTR